MNLTGEWLWGAIAIAVAVPVLLIVLTEVLSALQRKGSPAAGPVKLLRNWIVPVAALFLLLLYALRSEDQHAWTRVVATVLGFLLILLVLSAFNVALFGNARAGSWQERIPSIFVEIVRLLLVVVGLGVLFSWVWSADVGGLIAALGVTSIVIGLALQNAVGGVISGLLLLFEQLFKIGDWLVVSGTEGRVTEVNWRAVHLDTGSGIQIVPNSSLASASFTNKSQPSGAYWATTDLSFTTDDPPNEVMALLVSVADGVPGRVAGNPGQASYRGAGAYRIAIPVAGPAAAGGALSIYLSWLWYASRRRGFALDGDATDPLTEPQRLDAALQVVATVLHLRPDDTEAIRPSAHLERFGAGETVLPAGVVPDDVFFIVSGSVTLAIDLPGGGRVEFATSEAGDFVGHTALTREVAQATTIANEVLTLLVIPIDTIDDLVRTRPRLAAEIGESLDLKRRLAAEALAEAGVAGIIAIPGGRTGVGSRNGSGSAESSPG